MKVWGCMKHVFIMNPKAGKFDLKAMQDKINEVFSCYDYVIEVTKKSKDATLIARRYAQSGLDLCIYACGGDGTINEVVNGMYEYPNAKLAIFPIGTGNDFIKVFDEYTRSDFLHMSNYRHAKQVTCDLMKINDRVSINTASVGFDVTIAKNVEHFKNLPLIKGVIPYYMALLHSMMTSLAHEYTILLDGKALAKEEYTFVVAGNGRYYGGGFCPSPSASINDGFIDVCFIKKVTRRKIIRLSGKYKKGTHLQYEDIVSLKQCKKIQILSKDKVAINLDGEVVDMINPCIEILPAQITLCLPNKEK
ncbi:MAG: diacylglycerol kinase family lipid kinase [Erysipelotrichia bacterium]|nr:diacylglycerol kinase family lipid kinase [Erysipelotrichia bacterium]NCC55230.1 diacylglycerol kinase family lipid kinase [Erysipelotrichia bacterium]